MFDVCAFGDMLIDFVPELGKSDTYKANIGGTAANFIVGCGKLGLKSKIVGKVGSDSFGKQIVKEFQKNGVDTGGIVFDKERSTTMTFVSLKDGERSFSFVRRYAADCNLKSKEIDLDSLLNTKVIYFTGMTMTNEPMRSITIELAKEAKKRKIYTIMDINYRSLLWDNKKDFQKAIKQILPYLDVYKSSKEEINLLLDSDNLKTNMQIIEDFGPKFVFVSDGSNGSSLFVEGENYYLPTYNLKRIDTTGAGDSFMSACSYCMFHLNIFNNNNSINCNEMLDFANAAGALAITRYGGTSSLPSIDEIIDCRKTKEHCK